MSAPQVPPAITQDTSPLGGAIIEHDAFGCVTVARSRVGGSGARLFGSDLAHHTTVRLELSRAEGRRSLSRDWHHAQELVAVIEMSEAQWVSLIASHGLGEGVPVTFTHRRTGELLQCPEIAPPELTKQGQHIDEMRASLLQSLDEMKAVADRLAQMVGEAGSFPKKELAELSRTLSRAVEHAPSNAQFAVNQFSKMTETAVSTAKVEIEAFTAGMAQHVGLQHLRESAPRIDFGAGANDPT